MTLLDEQKKPAVERTPRLAEEGSRFVVADYNITPTDVSQFLRLEGCERYFRLRLYQKAHGDGFLYDFDVAPQAITPLLTAAGLDFEQRVEKAAAEVFPVLNCAEADEEGTGADTDNALVADRARRLRPGKTLLLFQPRLAAALGVWSVVGDVDILRLHRDYEGLLHILIVDIKATTTPKTEHRLQVAFYAEMIAVVLAEAAVAAEAVDIGILYRGPADGGSVRDLPPLREAAQRGLAKRLLGLSNALLEVIPDKHNYTAEVRDLLVGPDALTVRIAERPFHEVSYRLGLKCDGCLFNEYCLKDSHERGDLSLIPYLTDTQKNYLQAEGVLTVQAVAELMHFEGAENAGKDALMTPMQHKPLVRRLQAGGIGSRLEELVLRARQVIASSQRQQVSAGADLVDADLAGGEATK